MTYVSDEIWEILNFDGYYCKCGDSPICTSTRHERFKFPEVFGEPNINFINPLGRDIMLRTSGKYQISFTMVNGTIKKWELIKNVERNMV